MRSSGSLPLPSVTAVQYFRACSKYGTIAASLQIYRNSYQWFIGAFACVNQQQWSIEDCFTLVARTGFTVGNIRASSKVDATSLEVQRSNKID